MPEDDDDYPMPAIDDNVGTCGIYVHGTYKSGIYVQGREGYCNQPSVARMAVLALYDDEYTYHRGSFFVPYVGDEVMVDVCRDHKDRFESAHRAALQLRADRRSKEAQAQAKVEAARAALEEAERELRRI